MNISAFDIGQILDKKEEFYGYVAIDDYRAERVLSDETHRILTRILNHYIASNAFGPLTSMVEEVRDEIIRNSNAYPIAWIFRVYQYASNFREGALGKIKAMLAEISQTVNDKRITDYMNWLMKDPFISISLKVYAVKETYSEKGFLKREKVIIENLEPFSELSFRLLDPLDHFLWNVLTDQSGNATLKVLPIVHARYGRTKYKLISEIGLVEFDPLSHQQIELILAEKLLKNLITRDSGLSWLMVCPLCNREIRKSDGRECSVCGLKVCDKCLITEGLFRKRTICKSCKSGLHHP